MFRRMNALIWLRNQLLVSNKNLAIQILLPYMLVLLYKNFMDASGMKLMLVHGNFNVYWDDDFNHDC